MGREIFSAAVIGYFTHFVIGIHPMGRQMRNDHIQPSSLFADVSQAGRRIDVRPSRNIVADDDVGPFLLWPIEEVPNYSKMKKTRFQKEPVQRELAGA